MKLFAQWNSKSAWKAEMAVEKISSQRKLARIAVEARTWEARLMAVGKLKAAMHQSLLAQIATKDENDAIRLAAVKKLIAEKHIELLAKIATTDKDYNVCLEALDKLLSNEPRYSESMHCDTVHAQSTRGLMASESMHCDNVYHARPRYHHCMAIKHLDVKLRPEKLIALAQRLRDPRLRIMAFQHILPTDNQQMLAEIASVNVPFSYLEPIIEKLTDQQCLFNVAMNAPNQEARRAALGKLTDDELRRQAVAGFIQNV